MSRGRRTFEVTVKPGPMNECLSIFVGGGRGTSSEALPLNLTLLLSCCVILGESVVSLGMSFLCIKYGHIAGFLGNTESETSILTWHMATTQEFFPILITWVPRE